MPLVGRGVYGHQTLDFARSQPAISAGVSHDCSAFDAPFGLAFRVPSGERLAVYRSDRSNYCPRCGDDDRRDDPSPRFNLYVSIFLKHVTCQRHAPFLPSRFRFVFFACKGFWGFGLREFFRFVSYFLFLPAWGLLLPPGRVICRAGPLLTTLSLRDVRCSGDESRGGGGEGDKKYFLV